MSLVGSSNNLGKNWRSQRTYNYGSKTAQFVPEIKKLSNTTKSLIQKTFFKKIVQTNTSEFTPNIIFQTKANVALQQTTNDYILDVLKSANTQTIYGKRSTIAKTVMAKWPNSKTPGITSTRGA